MEKKKIIVFLFVLIMVLSVCSCDSGKLVLSGNVFIQKFSEDFTTVKYERFLSDLTFLEPGRNIDGSSNIDGNGKITGGKFNYSIGEPASLNIIDEEFFLGIETWYGTAYTDFRTSENVMGFALERFPVDSDDFFFLTNSKSKMNVKSNSYKNRNDKVFYIYVDRNVTISAAGNIENFYHGVEDHVMATKDFNLKMRAGWNAVTVRREVSGIYSGTYRNPTRIEQDIVETVSRGNPSLRWILVERPK